MPHLLPEDVLGPAPPPPSSAIAASDLAAFTAFMDTTPDDAYTSLGFDRRANQVIVRVIDGASDDVVAERAFEAGEGAAAWKEAEQAYEQRQDEWMLGKTRAEIEPVFGWQDGLTEEDMQADLRESLGL